MPKKSVLVAIHEMKPGDVPPEGKPVPYWLQLSNGDESTLLAISPDIVEPPADSQIVAKFQAWKKSDTALSIGATGKAPRVFFVVQKAAEIEFRAAARIVPRNEHDGEVLYVWPRGLMAEVPVHSPLSLLRIVGPWFGQAALAILVAAALVLVSMQLKTGRKDLDDTRNRIAELKDEVVGGWHTQHQVNQALQAGTDEILARLTSMQLPTTDISTESTPVPKQLPLQPVPEGQIVRNEKQAGKPTRTKKEPSKQEVRSKNRNSSRRDAPKSQSTEAPDQKGKVTPDAAPAQ